LWLFCTFQRFGIAKIVQFHSRVAELPHLGSDCICGVWRVINFSQFECIQCREKYFFRSALTDGGRFKWKSGGKNAVEEFIQLIIETS
jgi:hypothetical protein